MRHTIGTADALSNTLGAATLDIDTGGGAAGAGNVVDMVCHLIEHKIDVCAVGAEAGLHLLPDSAGTHVECQIIDTARLNLETVHPDLNIRAFAQTVRSRPATVHR